MKPSENCAIDAVPLGAVLAADVVDENGRVLMPAGATLTETVLNGLRRREIVNVMLVSAAMDPAQSEAQRVRVENQLARLFRHAGDQTEARALRHVLLNHRLKDFS